VTKIEAVIPPFRLDEVKEALAAAGVHAMTVSEVKRCAGRSVVERYRGSEYAIEFTPQIKLEIVVDGDDRDRIMDVIERAAPADHDGDGTIVAMAVGDVVRIRTGQRGRGAA
jgi:nitrogen regulatory protein PII